MRLPARDDRGDIILGWLTRISVILAAAGLVLFDAISVGTTAMTLSDQGSLAAREASETFQESGSLQLAYEAAVASALEADADTLVDATTFTVDPDNTVHLTVSRTADSILLFRWSRTAEWAEVERRARGRSVA